MRCRDWSWASRPGSSSGTLSPAHLAVAAAVAFATGTRPERWVVAPLLLVALVWLVAVVEKVLPAGRLPLR
jgi:predicted metal-binding membrane protein